MKKYNRKIDVIIPAYNVPDAIIFRCLASIACQDIVNELEVTIVDDASTKQNYQAVADHFSSLLKINILRYETNGGPGVARQYGIDHTKNGYMTFIDADDTFNGAFALKALRNGLEMNGGLYHTCVGVFDEVHEEGLAPGDGPILMTHEQDMVWMFGKLYRRSFIDKYNIHFHESSRANEDNGFNTMIRLCSNDQEQVNFIAAHVYYWHENPTSITRANDCQYSYGSSERDSFYGYVENMIFAIKEAKKRNPYNGFISMWAVNCMLNIYEYYIECYARANEHAAQNFKWCKRYYDEVYAAIEPDISDEMLAQQYNEVMRNAYMGDKMNSIIPCMGIFEFLDKLKEVELDE
ncbi:MAG: glycosyltransferase family 2 protein [Bacteroidaceae bacterium]|nr:glycosyltransferase family 2 protein [Bacteroidaceae bacterium]